MNTQIICSSLKYHHKLLMDQLCIPWEATSQTQAEDCRITKEFHIYTTTIISWKITKCLRILPHHYPCSISTEGPPVVAQAKVIPTEDLQAEYPSVFDGLVKTMEGELFHIALTEDAKPFCIHTPCTIPYAFRDKLKAELELLQEQNIIAPVTEPTEWCVPSW